MVEDGGPVSIRPPAPRAEDVEAVERALRSRLAAAGEVLRGVSPELEPVVDVVERLAAGGKRLRASFCLWGAHAASHGDPVPGLVEAAAALELFHLGALVHDDVMDRSDTRRGVPTVHRVFTEHHHDDGLAGDATTFGDSVAVLVGDLCLTWSDDLLARGLRAAAGAGSADAARAVWERMRSETMAGQYLDLLAQGRPRTTPQDAERVLRYKSAKYTVEHPLLLGGALAGAPDPLLTGYAEFGLRVGEAFQLRDDVLGVFGDSRSTGKPSGDDVREGKRTVLVAYAEQEASSAQRQVLRRHLGRPDLDAAGLTAVREVLVATGALARVEGRIDVLVGGALEVLASLPVSADAREALTTLTEASVRRAA